MTNSYFHICVHKKTCCELVTKLYMWMDHLDTFKNQTFAATSPTTLWEWSNTELWIAWMDHKHSGVLVWLDQRTVIRWGVGTVCRTLCGQVRKGDFLLTSQMPQHSYILLHQAPIALHLHKSSISLSFIRSLAAILSLVLTGPVLVTKSPWA